MLAFARTSCPKEATNLGFRAGTWTGDGQMDIDELNLKTQNERRRWSDTVVTIDRVKARKRWHRDLVIWLLEGENEQRHTNYSYYSARINNHYLSQLNCLSWIHRSPSSIIVSLMSGTLAYQNALQFGLANEILVSRYTHHRL